jgi:hypothetical protein
LILFYTVIHAGTTGGLLSTPKYCEAFHLLVVQQAVTYQQTNVYRVKTAIDSELETWKSE